uniref:Uncharacterized protein n=1 Tax=Araucaria cunninghamii TaxID=56994 RepID=A0A0D6R010_ARACU
MTMAASYDCNCDSCVEAVSLFDAYTNDATFLRWLSLVAALYLLGLRKTNWLHISMQIMPLVVYMELNLPSILFNIIREDFGRWVTLLILTLRICLQQYILDFCGFPVALLLLTVTVPQMLAKYIRNNILTDIISVGIGSYLLEGHIRSRELLQASTEKWYWVNTLANILLLLSPLLELYRFVYEVWQYDG